MFVGFRCHRIFLMLHTVILSIFMPLHLSLSCFVLIYIFVSWFFLIICIIFCRSLTILSISCIFVSFMLVLIFHVLMIFICFMGILFFMILWSFIIKNFSWTRYACVISIKISSFSSSNRIWWWWCNYNLLCLKSRMIRIYRIIVINIIS
jgi:hypothetical protein